MKRFTKKIAVLGFAVAMGAATIGSLAAKSAKSFALASAAFCSAILRSCSLVNTNGVS